MGRPTQSASTPHLWARVLLLCASAGVLLSLSCQNADSCVYVRDLTYADGSPLPCAHAEDCPRTSVQSICVDDGVPQRACVRCDEFRCVEVLSRVCP